VVRRRSDLEEEGPVRAKPRNVRVRAREEEAPVDERPRRKVEVRTRPEPAQRPRRGKSAADPADSGKKLPASEPESAPKSANRRVERTSVPEEPADALAVTPLASVPPPPRGERFARARRIALGTLKLVAVLAGIAGAVAVGRLTRDYVRTSPAFAIATIELEGRARLEESDVLRAAGVSIGTNVFELAPEDVRARLERHPWIASAEVERRLPGTFRLRIVERTPSLVLSLGPSLYLVDESGSVFKEVAPGDPVDLPIVSGIDRDRFLRERAWRTALLSEIDVLLDDWRAAGLWRREPIAEIHVEADDGLVLHVGEDAMEVRLGRAPFLPKLRKLRRVLDRLDAESSRALYVHLDNVRRPDRVVVRLREEPEPVVEATPEASPGAPTPG
jgi:cell division protein FtsQ